MTHHYLQCRLYYRFASRHLDHSYALIVISHIGDVCYYGPVSICVDDDHIQLIPKDDDEEEEEEDDFSKTGIQCGGKGCKFKTSLMW